MWTDEKRVVKSAILEKESLITAVRNSLVIGGYIFEEIKESSSFEIVHPDGRVLSVHVTLT